VTQANLLNHLWQSTVFAAAAGLLTFALRKHRAPVRYWLWFAASIKFLIPFSVLVTIGSQFEVRKASATERFPAYAAPLAVAIKDVSRPFVPSGPAPADHTPIFLGLWVCGGFVVVISWGRQWLRVRSALRAASPLDLKLPIRAMSSPARLEPGIFGVFRPILLVPEGITDRLTPDQWNAIVAHELCHVRRRDNLTAAIHMAVEAIFWFHPVVWWIGKRLIAERERACDEAVLLTSGNPESYAEGILNVCKLYVGSPLSCVSGVTGSNLKNRIRAIMTQRVAADLAFAKKLVFVVAAFAAFAAPVAIGVLHVSPLVAQSVTPVQPPASPTAVTPPTTPIPTPRMVTQPAPNAPGPTAQAQAPAPPAAPPIPEPPTRSPRGVDIDSGTYIIGPNHVVDSDVFGNPQKLYPVSSDGNMYVYDVRSKKFSVVGSVKRPGAYSLIQSITVFEAINNAGGFLDNFSNQKDILILRGNERLHFDYKAYVRGENLDQNVSLQDGDTIVVR
jgi:beta-lactamase regulating signal transducer with metallopeptidase domain